MLLVIITQITELFCKSFAINISRKKSNFFSLSFSCMLSSNFYKSIRNKKLWKYSQQLFNSKQTRLIEIKQKQSRNWLNIFIQWCKYFIIIQNVVIKICEISLLQLNKSLRNQKKRILIVKYRNIIFCK